MGCSYIQNDRDIHDFSVLNVPISQPEQNTAHVISVPHCLFIGKEWSHFHTLCFQLWNIVASWTATRDYASPLCRFPVYFSDWRVEFGQLPSHTNWRSHIRVQELGKPQPYQCWPHDTQRISSPSQPQKGKCSRARNDSCWIMLTWQGSL